jgi:hypothetical protein
MTRMPRNDAMRDPFFAPILFKIETVLGETDQRAKAQGLTLSDSAIRSLLVRAANEARGKPAKTSATSPKDLLLADAVARLAAVRSELVVTTSDDAVDTPPTEPLPTADWLLSLDATKRSCEFRTTSEPGSRGYLDFLEGFLRDAGQRAKQPQA